MSISGVVSSIWNSLDFSSSTQPSSATRARAAVDKDLIDKITCPFWKLVVSRGDFDGYVSAQGDIYVPILTLVSKANQLGLSYAGGLFVASAVSAGQVASNGLKNFGYVELTTLSSARGVAHKDGFAFSPNDGAFDKAHFLETLKYFNDNSDTRGMISFKVIDDRKNDIARNLGVPVSKASEIENILLFTFLGGNVNGEISVSDIEKLFNGQEPVTTAKPETSLR